MALPPSPSLGSEQPLPTREDWRRAVDQVLAKGADDLSRDDLDRRFAKQLVTTLIDGIPVQPLYTIDDVAGLADIGWPGTTPFVRGSASAPGAWEVRQRVELGDAGATAGRVLHELERGATGVWLVVGPDVSVDADVLDAALAGVYLELVPVALDALDQVAAATALLELWQRRGVSGTEARGSLGLDARGERADAVADIARRCAAELPGVRAVTVDGLAYHEAGASDAEELGCALAAGVEALRALTDRGLTVDEAAAQVELRVAVTADQFSSIAKLRALRALWSRVGEVAGASEVAGSPCVHAVTSRVMLTRYDPWVNMLRNTVACFAAGIGGADAVTVLPHDEARAPGEPSELARRMARNTQAILTDESSLARALDAAGGSWYVESLTDALADVAWRWFQEIEGAGGLTAAFDAGLVQERHAATWVARQRRLATRAEPITGVSEFPDIDEPPPPPVTDGLPAARRAAAFEALRDAALVRGDRPAVVLVGIGTPAEHNARSTFVKNLVESGGLRTVLVEGSDLDALAAAAAQAGPSVAVLCSTDARYTADAAGLVAALRAAGIERVYLAGRPGDWGTDLDGHLYAGCDALAVLHQLHHEVGVAPAQEGASR